MEKFSYQKLGDDEARRLAKVLEMAKEEYGAEVRETPDEVFVTALNKEGKEVTYGFTKIGDKVAVAGKETDFARLVEQTIKEKCQKKIAG